MIRSASRIVDLFAGTVRKAASLPYTTALATFVIFCTTAYAAPIGQGDGESLMRVGNQQLQVFTYRPDCPNPSLLIVMHGLGRNADGYRTYARPLADRHCLLVVAPLFDAATYPSWRYQQGGIAHRGVVQDRSQWTGRMIDQLADQIQRREGRRMTYSIIGHSAGGQFLSRFAAFTASAANRIVIANPGSHVFATLSTKAPYGLGGVFSPRDANGALREYLRRPVILLLGRDDTGDKDLTTAREAVAQGQTRYERGINAYRTAQAMARSRGWEFNWRLVEVPGVGHSARSMFGSAQAWEACSPEPNLWLTLRCFQLPSSHPAAPWSTAHVNGIYFSHDD